MEAQSVVERNDGYRGWRHEGAVAMATKKEKEGASVVAGGGGHRRRLHEGGSTSPPFVVAARILLIWGVTVCHTVIYRSNSLGTAPMHRVDQEEECTFISDSRHCMTHHDTTQHNPTHHNTPQQRHITIFRSLYINMASVAQQMTAIANCSMTVQSSLRDDYINMASVAQQMTAIANCSMTVQSSQHEG